MKRRLLLTLVLSILFSSLGTAQKVEGIRYVTEFGIPVKIEKSWHFSKVTQNFDIKETPEGTKRQFDFNIGWYPIIKLTDFEIKVMNAKGEVVDKPKPGTPPASLPPGKYSAEITGTYAEGFGKVSFLITGLELKDPPTVPPAQGKKAVPKSSITSVRLDFNLPQVRIRKSPADLKGKTRWDLETFWAPGKKEAGYVGRPKLFEAGKLVQGIEGADWWGTYKPGKYDLLLSADISRAGKSFDVRIPGINMEANTRYQIDFVLNGGAVIVKSQNMPHLIHFYLPGTADKAGDIKSWTQYPPNELWRIEGPGYPVCCPPGTYDILFNFGHGAKYEWRKNIRIDVGSLVELK